MSETTRDKIRQLALDGPLPSLADIGRLTGVSRERVRQIVEAEGLSPGPAVSLYQPRPAASPSVITGGVAVKVSRTVTGTIGELLAAADLSARGYVVFFPLVRTAICDLLAMKRDGLVLRIEVRTGHRSGKRILFAKKTNSPAEHYAVVVTGEPITYVPPLP